MKLSLQTYRKISILEGISFLVLLGIAMPLKYIWNFPEMVQIFGMFHGILFILYITGAYLLYQQLNWPFKTFFIVVFCSVLPFGPFYAEKKYLK